MKRRGKQHSSPPSDESSGNGSNAASMDGTGDAVKGVDEQIREVDNKAREMEEKRAEKNAEKFFEKLAESVVIAFCLAMAVKAIAYVWANYLS